MNWNLQHSATKLFFFGVLFGVLLVFMAGCESLPEKHELLCLDMQGKWYKGLGCSFDD